MLYFGPRFFPYTALSTHPKAAAKRARYHVVNTLHAMSNPCHTRQAALSQAAANLADLPTYHFFPELTASFSDPDLAHQRGLFQRINTATIDLPSRRAPPHHTHADRWIQRLPEALKPLLQRKTNPFQTAILTYINTASAEHPLPTPKLYATTTEYLALLAKLEDAGMLHWSVFTDEPPQYTSMASTIEMTLFSVTKSEGRGRLISWPRIQNHATPQPPHTSLPNPAMFEAIRLQGENPGAFLFDISNMFHNITLPLWLARLLPLQPVLFSQVQTHTQLRIMQRTLLPSDKSRLLLRPCQATMPMGFKWAVFIAHHFVSSCIDESFNLLKSTPLAFPDMSLTRLQGEDAPFLVKQRNPLLLHIIDAAAVLTVDWPPALVLTWHRLVRRVLEINQIPVALAKSSNPQMVIQESITFIGCIWHLTQGLVVPSPDKLELATARALALLDAQTSTSRDWMRPTGKLLWFANLHRPLLACTQAIFSGANGPPRENNQTKCVSPSKRELRTLTALLPFARVDINLPIAHIIVAFDASLTAGAVTYAYATYQLVEKLWVAVQSARFQRGGDPSEQLPEVTVIVQACHWKLTFTHA